MEYWKCGIVLLVLTAMAANGQARDTRADTWVATDSLGRTVSTHEEARLRRGKDKFVGIFYFLWMGQHGTNGPYDVTKILAADPDAMREQDSPLWGPPGAFHHWGEPLFGYYLSDDAWVIRKHAQMLSDAGVDVIIFDVTNQITYQKVYMRLCETFEQVRREGGKTPQIAFLTPFWDPPKVVKELYENLYKPGLYSDLWFQWKGKPLILADKDKVPYRFRSFFTYRKPEPSYFVGPSGPNQWGWLEVHPQHIFYDEAGKPEQMTVGIGQNGKDPQRCAAFSESDTHGRSWHDGKKDEHPGVVNLGLNVGEQWERALDVDPEFIFITGWNEWIAMRLSEFNGVKEPVMFVDQYTQEYSRDIEPMRGGHWDAYYYQMVDYIRKFKGARKPASVRLRRTTISDFADWKGIRAEYLDDAGDTMHRDHPGYDNVGRYVNTSGRNDFVLMKVTHDAANVYFYAQTREAITPQTDPSWMMLFVSTGRSPGWEGYDFVVNRKVGVLEESSGGWNWHPKATVDYHVTGNELWLTIPRNVLGLTGPVRFDFKWADNMQSSSIMEFTVNGDSAPNGRFNYRYSE